MSTTNIREQMIEEIKQIPEEKLYVLLELIQRYRKRMTISPKPRKSISDFAGTWKEIGTQDYGNFLDEISHRRKRATRRRDV